MKLSVSERQADDLALARYSVIAPLVCQQLGAAERVEMRRRLVDTVHVELYDGDFCLLSATDPLAQVTVGFQLVDKKDVDAAQMGKFFEYLESIGAKPKVVISDESKLYPAALGKAWPDVLHQLCEFHFIRLLINDVIGSVRAYVQSMPKNPKRRRGRPCKRGRPRVDHDEKRSEVHRKRFMVSMNPDKMSPNEEKTLDELLVEHPALAIPREFMLKTYRMFDPAGDLASAQALRKEILDDPRFQADTHLSASLKRLQDDERFAKLTLFLGYENLNRTNNDVERDNQSAVFVSVNIGLGFEVKK